MPEKRDTARSCWTYAAGIGGNDAATLGQVLVGGKRSKSDELVGDDLDTNKLTDSAQILVGHTEQPSNRVQDVTKDELQGQGIFDDEEVLAPPGEESVNETDKGDDTEQSSNDHTSDL